MKRHSTALALALATALWAPPAHSFCGFYVAAGDARLFNRSSKVVLVRDGDRTVLTMANDFRGDPKQFAIVIPVPVVLEKGQIQVGEPALIDHLDAYSAPRLVEYFAGSKPATRSGSTTSSSSPRPRAAGSSSGCASTAIGSRRAPRGCSTATSARGSSSSSPG